MAKKYKKLTNEVGAPIADNENALTAPLAQVMQLAKVHVYQNDQLIQTLNIEDDVQIKEANIFERFFMWIKDFLQFLL